MQLLNYNEHRFPQLRNESVSRKSVRKLYYVHDGRNAWHSTWVQRYLDGCMHSSLSSAIRYAESLRVRGSVYYINEIPALLLESESLVLVVTQINCTDVLAAYSSNAVRNEAASDKQKIENLRHNYLTRGSPIEGAFLSFEPDSHFWKNTPPPRDSLIRVLCEGSLRDFESLGKGVLSGYKSKSCGSQYLLEWSHCEHKIQSDALHRIMKERPRKPLIHRASGSPKTGMDTGLNVVRFATELGLPTLLLLKQLQAAGISKMHESDTISERDKAKLLEYLRPIHNPG